jgi:hypothetical protein
MWLKTYTSAGCFHRPRLLGLLGLAKSERGRGEEGEREGERERRGGGWGVRGGFWHELYDGAGSIATLGAHTHLDHHARSHP